MTFKATLAGVSILLVCGCSQGPAAGQVSVREPEAVSSVDADTAAQNRINSFLYVAVVPKLQSCWSRVQGEGQITFKYTYRRSGSNWVWGQQKIESSNLATDQQSAAAQCMQEAAAKTSFPMEAAEAARMREEFVVHWTWPVPFPKDVAALGRIINPGGGGECSKKCVKCACPFTPGSGVSCSCESSCSGYTPPCTVHADRKGCNMALPACASGGIGGGGGIIIASLENGGQSSSRVGATAR